MLMPDRFIHLERQDVMVRKCGRLIDDVEGLRVLRCLRPSVETRRTPAEGSPRASNSLMGYFLRGKCGGTSLQRQPKASPFGVSGKAY